MKASKIIKRLIATFAIGFTFTQVGAAPILAYTCSYCVQLHPTPLCRYRTQSFDFCGSEQWYENIGGDTVWHCKRFTKVTRECITDDIQVHTTEDWAGLDVFCTTGDCHS